MQSLADEWLIKNQHKILIFPWFIDYFLGTRRHIAKKTSKYDAGFHFLNEQGDVDESGTWYKLNFGSERFLACLLRGLNCPNWKKFVFLRVMDRFRGTRRQWRRVPLKKTKKPSFGRPKFKIENWATLHVSIGGKDMTEFRSQIRETFF